MTTPLSLVTPSATETGAVPDAPASAPRAADAAVLAVRTAPAFEVPVTSPCIGVCQLLGDTCLGCGRTLAEIAAWSRLDTPAQRAVVAAATSRLAILEGVAPPPT